MALGDKLKKLRKERSWTQWDLAKKLGVIQTQINRWESNKYTPSLDVLKKLSKIFDISLDTLIFDDKDLKSLKIQNKSLLTKLKKIDQLPPSEQQMIIKLIETLGAKRA